MRSARFNTLREPARRIGTVTLGATATLGVITAPTQATWNNSLTNAGPGFDSRHWYDTGGSTNIKFTGRSSNWSDHGSGDYCFAVNYGTPGLNVAVRTLMVTYWSQ
ncbi:hypothetical protein AB0O86_05870 [Streptomyces hirsutus]|uniref:hypothetical protein n=1 Tax=Streptomyces hirsutus TaxID=35620 RepID=UPI00342D8A54